MIRGKGSGGHTEQRSVRSLLGNRYSELLPSLGPAGVDDLPARGRGHPGTETVLPNPLGVMWLICSFHGLTPWLVRMSNSSGKIMGKSARVSITFCLVDFQTS